MADGTHQGDLRVMAELCREALQVQDACNLSGVVFGFARAMERLCEIASRNGYGTKWKNTHPVSVLWADKIAHLTGTQALGHEVVMRALTSCEKLAKGIEQ